MSNSGLLYDVHLPSLTAPELRGAWRVARQRAGTAAAPWTEATQLRLDEATLQLHAGPKAVPGTWQLLRHEGLRPPYLALHTPAGATQALITRLRRSPDGTAQQMQLYFQSGMEWELSCP